MKFNLTLLLLCLFTGISQMQAQRLAEKYHRIKIHVAKDRIRELASLGLDMEHGAHAPGTFTSDFSEYEIGKIVAKGFAVDTLIYDVSDYYVRQNRIPATILRDFRTTCNYKLPENLYEPENYKLGTMGGFFRYEEMLEQVHLMHTLYPRLISDTIAIDTFRTWEGRPIYYLRLTGATAPGPTKPTVFYNAVHHAREPASLSQLIYFMWYLLEQYDSDLEIQDLIDNTEIIFVPCVNPDGYIFNQENNPDGGGLWRKNRWRDEHQVWGVDLNRNYPAHWGYDDIGSSPDTISQVYRGPAPASEPEVRAMMYMCQKFKFKLVHNYHTFGNLLIYPYGYSNMPTEDHSTYELMTGLLSADNNFTIGFSLETVGYTVNGDSDDWMYGDSVTKPKMFSWTPEVGSQDYAFWPPESEVINVNKLTIQENMNLLRLAHNGVKHSQLFDPFSEEDTVFRMRVKQFGLLPAFMWATVTSIDNKVYTTKSSWYQNTQQGKDTLFSWPFTPRSVLPDLDTLAFFTEVSDNDWVKQGLPQKLYFRRPYIRNTCDTLKGWTDPSDIIKIDTSDFITPPASFSVKLGGDTRSFELNDIIDLTNAEFGLLYFNAKWNTDRDYSYIGAYLRDVETGAKFYLCLSDARETLLGEPGLSGNSVIWRTQFADIAEYAGRKYTLGFEVSGSPWTGPVSFNIDDVWIKSQKALVSTDNPLAYAQEIGIYPNPVSDMLYIKSVNGENRNYDIVITNITGQTVFSGKSVSQVDIQKFPVGLYFIKISGMGLGSPVSLKFVREGL